MLAPLMIPLALLAVTLLVFLADMAVVATTAAVSARSPRWASGSLD